MLLLWVSVFNGEESSIISLGWESVSFAVTLGCILWHFILGISILGLHFPRGCLKGIHWLPGFQKQTTFHYFVINRFMCVCFTEWSSISTWISILGLLVLVRNLLISSQGNGFWMFAILTLNLSLKTWWWFDHDKKQPLNTCWVHFPCPSLWLFVSASW